MLATGVRPVAALKMDAAGQYDPERRLLDLHPIGGPRTRKRNPVVPVIDELHPILLDWAKDGAVVVGSRKTAWRTLRRTLGLPPAAEAKTIRNTVATLMRGMGVPPTEISGLLGHEAMKGSTAVYAKYDPTYLAQAKAALSTIFRDVIAEADRWGAVHLLSRTGNGRVVVLDRDSPEAQDFRAWRGGARRSRKRTGLCVDSRFYGKFAQVRLRSALVVRRYWRISTE